MDHGKLTIHAAEIEMIMSTIAVHTAHTYSDPDRVSKYQGRLTVVTACTRGRMVTMFDSLIRPSYIAHLSIHPIIQTVHLPIQE